MADLIGILNIINALAKLAELGVVTIGQAHAVVQEAGMGPEAHAALEAEYDKRIAAREAELSGGT